MKVHAEDILSFRTMDFDFTSRRLCCVFGKGPEGGSNGAGKSNFFDVLKLGLYGKNSKGLDKAGIIRKNAKQGKVIVWWQAGEEERRIIRLFKPAESVTLLVNGVDLRIPTLTEGQRIIDEWLGQDYQLFEATVMYAQEQTEFFVNADESEQKGLLEKILGFQRYTKAQELAKREEGRLSVEIGVINTKMATLNGKLEVTQDAVFRLTERLSAEEEHREGQRKELTQQLSEIKLMDVKKLTTKKEELTVKKAEASSAAAKAYEIMSKAQEIQADVRLFEQQCNSKLAEKTKLESQLGQVNAKSSGNCPTCGRKYDPASFKQTQQHLKDEIAEVEKEAKKASDKAQELATARSKYLELLVPLQVNVEKLEAIENQLQMVNEELEKRNRENERRRSEYRRLKDRIEALDQPSSTQAELDQQKGTLSSLKATMRDQELLLEGVTKNLALARFWVKGFGNQGIKSLLLDSYSAFINARINHYLTEITDGAIRARFNTQKQLKGGELRDKIDFKVTIDGVEFDYKAYSGGQKTVINLAAMLALRNLAAQERNLTPIMIMDETFSELDDRFSVAVHNLLKQLSRTTSIYVVSHTEGLRDWIPDYVTVVMDKARVSKLVA